MATLCNLQELLSRIPPEWRRYRKEKPYCDHGRSPCDAEGKFPRAARRRVRWARRVETWKHWTGRLDASSGQAMGLPHVPSWHGRQDPQAAHLTMHEVTLHTLRSRLLFLRSKDRRSLERQYTPSNASPRQRRSVRPARNPSSCSPSGAEVFMQLAPGLRGPRPPTRPRDY